MSLRVDPKQERQLMDLASQAGKAVTEVLHELIDDAIAARKRDGERSSSEKPAMVAQQQKALEDLVQELDALPSEGLPEPEGRAVSENVDEFLYRWKK